MRLPPAAVLIALLVCSSAAFAATFYKYHDKESGRDVYVNRLDQVPVKYRSQAKIVLETTDPRPAGAESTDDRANAGPSKIDQLTRSAAEIPEQLRKAAQGKSLWKDGPAVASAVFDAKLAQQGKQPLTGAERATLAGILRMLVIGLAVTGVVAFVLWIVVIIDAFRDDHPIWAIVIILFSPLAYVYLLFIAGPQRLLYRVGGALGMLSPLLFSLVCVLRFYLWLDAVMKVRGGPI